LFTDGVTEAEDKNRNLFGLVRLIEAFVRHSDCSLDSLQSGILGAVERFTEAVRQSDDITLLVVRYRRPAEGIGTIAENSTRSPKSM
jgi:sigma-B regulation protein RsbU (phosphoserine phosphatase)